MDKANWPDDRPFFLRRFPKKFVVGLSPNLGRRSEA